MIRVPRPANHRAVLWCESLGRPTKHVYVDTLECVLPHPDAKVGPQHADRTAWEHLFECEESGTQRRWGAEHRAPSSFDEPAPQGAGEGN